jgi:hypothetical protein
MKIKTLAIVIVVSVVLSTLGIGASDIVSGTSGSLLGQLLGSTPDVCPSDMVLVAAALSFTCVDTYEVSAAADCPYPNPSSHAETVVNLEQSTCQAVSAIGVSPWRFVTRDDAATACVRRGKRLPTATEWYAFSLGTLPVSCNLTTNLLYPTGKNLNCASPGGVVDAVGNVWEWVNDDIIEGVYNGRHVPQSGYVLQADSGGMATETNTVHMDTQFGADYFWSDMTGAYGILRGGFYGSQGDGGVYSVQGATKPTFSGAAVGFRCVI